MEDAMAEQPSITAATPAPVVRSEIWFEDGNVILQAENTQFKVHRGMLARNSSIFNDMFSVPQPPMPEEESVEGCVVIHLPDSAHDLEIVLRALIERGFAPSREPVSIKIVAAFLRLGRKYDFETLRTDALHRIFYEVPATLEDNDACMHNFQIEGHTDDGWFWINIVNLAREQSIQSVLPLALYECCRVLYENHGPSSIFKGITRADGSTALLSLEDQMICLSSYSTLLALQNTTTFVWLDAEDDFVSCRDGQFCPSKRSSLLRDCFFTQTSLQGLDHWNSCVKNNLFEDQQCENCNHISEQIHTAGRLHFWRRLPETFGLPEWQELIKEREEQNRVESVQIDNGRCGKS
ncbi:hypothetical protein HWV62_5375 [Athelia sp. TMB]|nr:hypothetical protein HWV62_5375 [Athelia sp. TMB]